MLAATVGLLGGCADELGRKVTDSDVSCLRAQMGARVALSFPMAANTCQRMTGHNVVGLAKHPEPIPLDLRGAPDLQAQAREYNYAYRS
ncbi:hypothetical protein KGY14_03585 [Ameyamaea chiangmaiensis]|uniref:Uncharacterized protein n=2 Tax=Ameyamaea chiangmaiensis TaxID=442969 RepID=A0A850P9J5_9PROT|nr:hypothetical protein [Ameyamaea chiangmaiensis]MBS4074271.1 hypothetical protein [Ameyamaea chiangmaiensis]NVN40578.1 hypothetical protein [Ameyamaea chiangmaiensis]